MKMWLPAGTTSLITRIADCGRIGLAWDSRFAGSYQGAWVSRIQLT